MKHSLHTGMLQARGSAGLAGWVPINRSRWSGLAWVPPVTITVLLGLRVSAATVT